MLSEELLRAQPIVLAYRAQHVVRVTRSHATLIMVHLVAILAWIRFWRGRGHTPLMVVKPR